MGSQCKSLSTGVMCSNLIDFVTTRAAALTFVLAGVNGWISLEIQTHTIANTRRDITTD